MKQLIAALLWLLSLTLALELVIFDVGQGDAVLIRAPDGRAVLYDAGEKEADVVSLLEAFGVSSLELVVASHAHADHIGGMAAVLRRFQPRFYLDNGLVHPTLTYERTLEAVAEVGATLLEPTRRQITLGEVLLEVVPPPGIAEWGQNDNSIGLRISYGAFSAFLPGDAEPAQWGYWLEHYPELLLPVTVHRASHHGSRNGDTEASLAALSPEVIIISAGAGNRYGHPHAEALARYRQVGARIYRTDQHGHIIVRARADGSYQITSQRAPESAPICIDINRADIEALRQIVHIDLERASQIISLRPFGSVDELVRVRGIGPARLADIKRQGLACVGQQ